MEMYSEKRARVCSSEELTPTTPSASEALTESDRAPLSFAQQRLWFLDQLEPGSSVYNVPLGIQIQGALRIEILQAALNELVLRHEALRTNFLSDNGCPVQIIRKPGPVTLLINDLSGCPGKSETELRRLLGQEAQRPFNLTNEPLLRAVLFRMQEHEHILLLSLHHIVCDEWSLPVLFRELGLLYEAFSQGKTSPLPELAIQYADFAVWQRDWLQGEALAQELQYWKKQLKGAVPRLKLPTDDASAAAQIHAGRRQTLALPSDLVTAIQELSRREGATLFISLLAAFKALLARYTGQDEITVGSPIAGRTRVETEALIGFFVNTLVLRTDLSGDPPFREVLKRVRQTAMGAYDHQELPFEKLVEELHPERSASQIPFIQVMFALQHGWDASVKLSDLELQLVDVETTTSKFDLTWVVQESQDGLHVCVESRTALFREDTVTRMLAHWRILLEGMLADPDRPLSQISLISAEERERVVVSWNQTKRDYPHETTIPALFEEQVRRRPEALAVRYGDSELSYRQLDERANQLASLLQGLGVGPEVRVGLCLQPRCDLIVGMLGILKAGAAYVPLDPSYPKERLRLMLEETKAPVLVTDASLRNALPNTGLQVVCVDALPHLPSHAPSVQANTSGSLAYVIFTSGSTGRPKGVLVEQRAITRLVCNTDYVQLTPDDRVAQASNIAFDAATFEIWGALLNGAALIGIGRDVALSPVDLGKQLIRDGVTTLFLTTALFNQVAAQAPGAFQHLKHLLFGGEAVDPKWVRRILEGRPPERLLHVYGPTEATTFASWHLITQVPPEARTVPIGRPIANTQLYLLDQWLEPVPVGLPGEVYVGGPGVARGYLNQPELTAQKFIHDPFSGRPGAKLYKTGDLARYRPDGNIEFIGRVDGQVKIRGFRVELGEIESALAAHPAVRETVVVARDADSLVGKRVVAFVVLKENVGEAALREVSRYLKDKLPPYMVPTTLVPISRLPLNANGKIDTDALPTSDQRRPQLEQEFLPPRTPTEEALVALWKEVLGVNKIGVRDSFFDLGGHSLLAVRLFAEIEQRFGKKLPLASLFHSPTVEQLARLIRTDEPSSHWPLLVEIQPQGSRPALFWVHSLGGDGGGAFFYYRKLARLLGADQPSYGIRSPQEPFSRIEDMAARYVEELLRFQPEGPYFLGGFCFGGIVAFEIACQLRRIGREVGLLVLLESTPPGPTRSGVEWRPQTVAALGRNLRSWVGDLVHQNPNEIVGRLQRKGKSIQKRLQRLFGLADTASGPDHLAELINMKEYPKDYIRYAQAHWQALLAYRPRPYSGRVTLFRARKQPLFVVDPTLGWGPLAEGGVAVNVIPGTHEKMLEEPNVHILAAELKTCLIEAQSDPADRSEEEFGLEGPEGRREAASSCPCSIIT